MTARAAEPAPVAAPAPDAGSPTPDPTPGVRAAEDRREGAMSPAPLSASDATRAISAAGMALVAYTLNPFDPLGRFAYRAGQLQGTLEGLLAVLDGGAGPELRARAIERARAELADETYQ